MYLIQINKLRCRFPPKASPSDAFHIFMNNPTIRSSNKATKLEIYKHWVTKKVVVFKLEIVWGNIEKLTFEK